MQPDMDIIGIDCRINGRRVVRTVETRMTLADFLRDEVGLTGTHVGCEQGVCGACTVIADGALARACLMLAAQVDGMEIETIEGATESGRVADLQEAFYARGALQCGFCTPGMVLTAAALLEDDPACGRDEIRAALTGQICRCTGYHAIVDAVEAAGRERCNNG